MELKHKIIKHTLQSHPMIIPCMMMNIANSKHKESYFPLRLKD